MSTPSASAPSLITSLSPLTRWFLLAVLVALLAYWISFLLTFNATRLACVNPRNSYVLLCTELLSLQDERLRIGNRLLPLSRNAIPSWSRVMLLQQGDHLPQSHQGLTNRVPAAHLLPRSTHCCAQRALATLQQWNASWLQRRDR